MRKLSATMPSCALFTRGDKSGVKEDCLQCLRATGPNTKLAPARIFLIAVFLTATHAADENTEGVTDESDLEITTINIPVSSDTPISAVPSSSAPISAVASPNPPIRQHASLDGSTLLPLLLASGGPPGEFPVENSPKGPSQSVSDKNCPGWIYEYTNSFPDGVLRHEHALYLEKTGELAVRRARGVYAKMQPGDKPSFAIEYDRSDDAAINITGTSKCNTTEWNVLICQLSDDVYKDYVVHGHQDPPCRDVPVLPAPAILSNGTTLESLFGIDSLRIGELPEEYDIRPILAHFGGNAGDVVSAWNRNFVPLEEPADPKERPLPDAKRPSWLYDFRAVNSPHSVRFEHATLRFKGQPDEFVDVRGTIYWRTSRGDFRIEYHQDDTGLRSRLNLAECIPIRGMWSCSYSTKGVES